MVGGMNRIFFYICVLLTLSVGGCSNVKNSLGLEKDAPDEFSVITRAPLDMPSELALPPPVPGAPRPQEQATIKQAKKAVFKDGANNTTAPSSAENILLEKSGARNSDPNIRATVNRETAELQDRNEPVAKKLLGFSGVQYDSSATVVDPKKELERLQKNKAEGKSATEGKTAIIEE